MELIRLGSWMASAILISNLMLTPFAAAEPQAARASDSQAKLQMVSVNQATMDELQTINGIGPALAERIVSYREANGKFKSLDQLKEVKGIGDAKFEKLKNQITL